MANIATRLVEGIITAAWDAPFIALVSGAGGYIYGKLADLPAGAIAKAYAVWSVAENSLLALSKAFTENKTTQKFICAAILSAGGVIGIQEMRKRGLMGDKLMYACIAVRVLTILGIMTSSQPPARKNEEPQAV